MNFLCLRPTTWHFHVLSCSFSNNFSVHCGLGMFRQGGLPPGPPPPSPPPAQASPWGGGSASAWGGGGGHACRVLVWLALGSTCWQRRIQGSRHLFWCGWQCGRWGDARDFWSGLLMAQMKNLLTTYSQRRPEGQYEDHMIWGPGGRKPPAHDIRRKTSSALWVSFELEPGS